jgi:hypothetical protein
MKANTIDFVIPFKENTKQVAGKNNLPVKACKGLK